MLNGKVFLTLLLAISSGLHGQEVRTLDSVLAAIRNNHPALQGYDYEIAAMNAYAEGADSWKAPMIGGGTFMTPYPGQTVAGEANRGMLMVAAEQAIPNPARLRAKENYMESKAAVTAASRAQAYNQLRARAKSLYYQWAVLEKKKAVLEENRQIMQTMLKLAEIRYPYNQGSLGSIYKAEGRLHEVENRILMTDNEMIEKNILLNSLMNIPRDARYRIDTSLQALGKVQAAIDTAHLLGNRSDLLRIRRSIESMQLGVELERMERKPEFSLRFEHMLPYDGMMPGQYTLMGMVSIPIAPWASKKYKSNVEGMQLEIRSMEKRQEAILSEASGLIAGIASDIGSIKQQLSNYDEKIIPALRRNYETTLLAYEQNQEQLPLVIDAWEALNMAQMEQLDKLEEYYLMIVQYEKELDK